MHTDIDETAMDSFTHDLGPDKELTDDPTHVMLGDDEQVRALQAAAEQSAAAVAAAAAAVAASQLNQQHPPPHQLQYDHSLKRKHDMLLNAHGEPVISIPAPPPPMGVAVPQPPQSMPLLMNTQAVMHSLPPSAGSPL